jgi:hypothetical protein
MSCTREHDRPGTQSETIHVLDAVEGVNSAPVHRRVRGQAILRTA